MLNKNAETLIMCSRLMMQIIINTREYDKTRLVEISGAMSAAAEESLTYSPALKEAYRKVYNFFKVVWKEDLQKIISITQERGL